MMQPLSLEITRDPSKHKSPSEHASSLPSSVARQAKFLSPSQSRADDRTSIRFSFAPQHKERPRMCHGVVRTDIKWPFGKIAAPQSHLPWCDRKNARALARDRDPRCDPSRWNDELHLVEVSLGLELSRPPIVYRESPERTNGTALNLKQVALRRAGRPHDGRLDQSHNSIGDILAAPL